MRGRKIKEKPKSIYKTSIPHCTPLTVQKVFKRGTRNTGRCSIYTVEGHEFTCCFGDNQDSTVGCIGLGDVKHGDRFRVLRKGNSLLWGQNRAAYEIDGPETIFLVDELFIESQLEIANRWSEEGFLDFYSKNFPAYDWGCGHIDRSRILIVPKTKEDRGLTFYLSAKLPAQ